MPPEKPKRKPRARANGEGTCYRRRSDGRWCASLVVGHANGKLIRRVWYGATQGEAMSKLKEARAELASGARLGADDITKQDLLDMENRMNERLAQIETKLLSAVHDWARTMEVKVRSVSAAAVWGEERLSLVEERLAELERRKTN